MTRTVPFPHLYAILHRQRTARVETLEGWKGKVQQMLTQRKGLQFCNEHGFNLQYKLGNYGECVYVSI